MRKKVRIIAVILLLINLLTCINVTKAANLNSANLYSKGDCGTLLKYNGTTVYTTFVVYNNNGVEYPAYCMQKELNGVGESGAYSVSINGLLTDVRLWRTITNGYPYKTPQQLGCATTQEAFTATKQAVYCTIYGNNVNNYTAIGEAGARTLNALKTIVNAANNSAATKVLTNIQITAESDTWNIDSSDSKYVSKTYNVKSEANLGKYKVNILNSLPEEAKITDINNVGKTEFSNGEKFKILLPITNIKDSNIFTINITTTLNTKPVFYGKAPKSNLQDYAITAATYEDVKGSLEQNYQKNETQIIIKKQDGDTKKPLSGVKFNLLDAKKIVAYKELVSDSEGKIILNNMLPGKYFLQEVTAKQGYTSYDKLIEINLDLNEIVNVTVNNSKTQISNVTNLEENISVSKKESEINVTNKIENTNLEENKTSQNINTTNESKEVKNNEEITNKTETNNTNKEQTNNVTENTNIEKNNSTVQTNNSQNNTNIVENNNKINNNTNIENTNIEKNNNTQTNTINEKNVDVVENSSNSTNTIHNITQIIKLPKTGM